MSGQQGTKRVSARQVEWVEDRLSERDRDVMRTVGALRLVTGRQLEQACFLGLGGRSRTVVRGRVLARLVRWRVLATVERRIGGAAKGSATAVYCLDAVGLALCRAVNRPSVSRLPGDRFQAHTLAISQLYADLVEQLADTTTGSAIRLSKFDAEPASWTADGIGGTLKPDAYVQLQTARDTWHFWVEVDRSTESIPTLERKLRGYLNFLERGQRGPGGVMPRVLISVIDDHRLAAVHNLIGRLPAPAAELFVVHRDHDAVLALVGYLRE